MHLYTLNVTCYIILESFTNVHNSMEAPEASISLLQRTGTESTVLCKKSGGTFVKTSRMRSCSCSVVRGLVLYTSSFAQPHRKKSHSVRSGLRAGHSCGPRLPSQRRGKWSSNQERTIREKCGGAPSYIKMTSFMFSHRDTMGQTYSCSIFR